MSFYIDGLKGTDGVGVQSEAYALTIYKVTQVGEITLSPETVNIYPGGNDTVTVTYSNIIPNSIQIDRSNLVPEIIISPQNMPFGNVISSGIFVLSITVGSEEATDLNHEYIISGLGSGGQTIMATGIIYVRP